MRRDLLDAPRLTPDALLFGRHAPRAKRLTFFSLVCPLRTVTLPHFFCFRLGHKPSTTGISGMQGKRGTSGLHSVLPVVGFVIPKEDRKNDVVLVWLVQRPRVVVVPTHPKEIHPC